MNTLSTLCQVYEADPPPAENQDVVGSPSIARSAGNSPPANSEDAADTPGRVMSLSGKRGSDEDDEDDDDDEDDAEDEEDEDEESDDEPEESGGSSFFGVAVV